MLTKDTKEGFLLIFVYSGFLAVAVVICALVGYEVDELAGEGIGVTVGIFSFFVACWLCWVLAVRVTEPRAVGTDAVERPSMHKSQH